MAVNAATVQYTGGPLSYINVTPNQDLATILSEINTAVNTHNTAPDYTGYNLYCVKQTDGTSHPTNTQNFAEGISKMFCELNTAYTTFTGTTYTAAISTLSTAVTGLQSPGITYAPFSITNTDTVTQVFNKNFTGIGTILTAINPNAANWATLSLSTQTTITGGFNALISYLSALNTTVSGKQATLGTFNNTGNCLAGGATDSISTTVAELITYACNLPTFAAGSITFGGVTSASDLQGTVQNTINTVSSLLTNGVVGAGTGLTLGSVGSTYQGKKLTIDTTYTQLYKSMVTSSDTTPNFLNSKLVAGTGITFTTVNPGANEQIRITNSAPETGEVVINSSDTSIGFLENKIVGATNTVWGIGLGVTVSQDNSQLVLTPTISPAVNAAALLTYISNTPELFAQFQQIVAQGNSGTCAAPTTLVVVLNTGTGDFDLTWTPSGSALSQNVKWRPSFQTEVWYTGQLITPVNPQTNSQSSATVDGTNLLNETIDFAIDSVCTGGGIGTSNVYQMIKYADDGSFTNTVVSGVIGVSQNPKILDNIFYRLKNAAHTVLQNITTTGGQPSVQFTAVASGNYTVEWSFGTLVNGITLLSTDSTQLNAWIASGTIVVP